MKKLFIRIWLVALLMLLMCRPSFAEDIYKFTSVCGYKGEVYCCYTSAVNGDINEEIYNPLPYGMHDLGCINSFTIYNDHIYYLTSSSSCGPTYASIYRCDMDGSDNVLIADDALNGSECYIADDMLYYTSFCSWKPCLRFNISCVNLNDFSHKTVIKDTWQIELWDGKYIFFGKESGGDYYRCDKDGKNICKMSEDDVEIFADLIYGGYGYKLYDGAIYKYDWSGNSKWISNTVRRVGDAILFDRGNNVENIIDGKVYYTMDVEWSAYYFRQNSVIYRCNMDGTNHEIVAAMFIP